MLASTDVQQWLTTYDVPGIWFEATDIQTDETTDEILTAISESQGQPTACTSLGRQPYSDPLYVGVSETFQDCAGTTTDFVWLAFAPPDNSFHGVVGVQIFSEADIARTRDRAEHVHRQRLILRPTVRSRPSVGAWPDRRRA